MSEQAQKWYEASIGWGPEKSWFLVDALPRPIFASLAPERQTEVEVTTREGEVSEITVRAQWPHLPTLAEVMAVVLADTHCDHHPVVKYHLVSRREGLVHQRDRRDDDALDRLRQCVPAGRETVNVSSGPVGAVYPPCEGGTP